MFVVYCHFLFICLGSNTKAWAALLGHAMYINWIFVRLRLVSFAKLVSLLVVIAFCTLHETSLASFLDVIFSVSCFSLQRKLYLNCFWSTLKFYTVCMFCAGRFARSDVSNCNRGVPNCLQERIFFQTVWIFWKCIDSFMVRGFYRSACSFWVQSTAPKLLSLWLLHRVFFTYAAFNVPPANCTYS